jgi:hypothetical protein
LRLALRCFAHQRFFFKRILVCLHMCVCVCFVFTCVFVFVACIRAFQGGPSFQASQPTLRCFISEQITQPLLDNLFFGRENGSRRSHPCGLVSS